MISNNTPDESGATRTLRRRRPLVIAALVAVAALVIAGCGSDNQTAGSANNSTPAKLPGEGKTILACTSTGIEGLFHQLIPAMGLRKLGYTVQGPTTLAVPVEHQSVASGQCAYMIDEWVPLHDAFFGKVKNQTVRLGPVIQDAVQGYLIDKKTADKYGITGLEQLRDPKLARLFAARGDKADLTGAEPGWGAERVINHELDALGLRKTVNHDQGQYFTLFADTLSRFRQGNPILFYTWTPNWTLTFLKLGKDVTFLKVPPSACLPDQPCGASTSGFPANSIYALTNKKFADDNAAARRFLGLVRIPIADINAENLKIKNGENKEVDVQRHVQQWIAAHQQEFDGWITQAKQAAQGTGS